MLEKQEAEKMAKDSEAVSKITTGILNDCLFSDEPEKLGAQKYVTNYHIDTEIGLRLFADTIKKYGLHVV